MSDIGKNHTPSSTSQYHAIWGKYQSCYCLKKKSCCQVFRFFSKSQQPIPPPTHPPTPPPVHLSPQSISSGLYSVFCGFPCPAGSTFLLYICSFGLLYFCTFWCSIFWASCFPLAQLGLTKELSHYRPCNFVTYQHEKHLKSKLEEKTEKLRQVDRQVPE